MPKTDNEIIKALDELVKLSSGIVINWEINQSDTEAIYKTAKNALDLINRKDAEIESLKEVKEINLNAIKTDLPWFVLHLKSEAIKEFAERFKEKYEKPFFYLGSYEQFMREVDNLVKEMTEVSE